MELDAEGLYIALIYIIADTPRSGLNLMIEAAQEDKSLRVIPASVILARIKVGKTIKYDHVRIEGDLDIDVLNLKPEIISRKHTIGSMIEIKSSVIDGTVDFKEGFFKCSVNFMSTRFTKPVRFNSVVFNGDVNFIESKFNGFANFDGSRFNSSAIFWGAQFSEWASFDDSDFKCGVQFNNSQFNKDFIFRKVVVGGPDVDFWSLSVPIPNRPCRDLSIIAEANFANSKFCEKALFKYTEFKDDVKFINSRFNELTSFNNCSFYKNLDLTGSNISTMILHNATFGEKSTILLKYSVFNRLEVPWKLIWSKLEIKQEGDDSKEDDKPKNDGSVYLALVKNYENLEWFDDADACYDQYMKKKGASIKLMEEPVKKLQHCCVSFWLYGFRVHPEYPLLAMLIIFTFSIPVYFFSGQASSPHEAFEISSRMLIGMPIRSSTDLTGLCNIWSIGERISGWILMSSFLVVLARKVLR